MTHDYSCSRNCQPKPRSACRGPAVRHGPQGKPGRRGTPKAPRDVELGIRQSSPPAQHSRPRLNALPGARHDRVRQLPRRLHRRHPRHHHHLISEGTSRKPRILVVCGSREESEPRLLAQPGFFFGCPIAETTHLKARLCCHHWRTKCRKINLTKRFIK